MTDKKNNFDKDINVPSKEQTNVCGECGWNSGVKLILEEVNKAKGEE